MVTKKATSKKRTSKKRSTKRTPAAPAAASKAQTTAAVQQQYMLSNTKQYSPRANTMADNARSWQTVQAFLQANKGRATLAQLQAHLAEQHNHASFAKYAVRRGWLVPAK